MKQAIVLEGGWQIHQLKTHGKLDEKQIENISANTSPRYDDWLGADMPAQVHDILLKEGRLKEGRIEDPVHIGTFEKCLWVAEQDWVYKKTFSSTPTGEKVFLHFKGLDTLVDVYINSKHIAFHNDTYLPLRVDVTDELEEENVLLLHFYSPHKFLKNQPFPPEWEGKIARHRIIRKPNDDFRNYLGAQPYFTKIGVYNEVQLEIVDEIEIERVDLDYKLSGNYSSASIEVTASGTGFKTNTQLQITIRDAKATEIGHQTVPIKPWNKKSWHGDIKLSVDNLELWWPRGYGKQPLYEIRVSLVLEGKTLDTSVRKIGFRDLKMGSLFDFTINGKKIKLWGANLIPLIGLSHCWDSDRLNQLLALTENCNINLLRTWGPGAPYHEELYDEADRRGILIWQDFFHTWGMYPNTEEFRELCRKEAEYYVGQLKHHPCIILWCGGNENHMGAELQHPGQPFIGREIFEEDYKTICERLDPQRYYHPNSPYASTYANDPLHGDLHDWTHIWYGPGEEYPLLFNELARSSAPLVKSLKRVISDKEFWPQGFTGMIKSAKDTPIPESWRRLDVERLSTYNYTGPIEQFYDTGDSPEGLVYRMGAAHSLYIRKCVERHRRGRPASDATGQRRCMGNILWRLNDAWPQIHASVIDYFLEPKMAYYALRRAYAPVLLSFDIGDHIYLWVVNDTPEKVKGTVMFQLFDPIFKNEVIKEIKKEVSVQAGESKVVMDLDELGMIVRQYMLYALLLDEEGIVISRSNDFLDIERRLTFPEAQLTVKEVGGTLEITTDRFARCVELSGDNDGDEFGWFFEDNFFDLFPGETKRVRILGKHRYGTVSAESFFSKHVATIKIGGT